MDNFGKTPHSLTGCLFAGPIGFSVNRCIGALLAASILMFAGNAYAVITVGLAIENDADSNGDITVVNGGKVKVAYTVIEDTDKDLKKTDKIQLLRVSDDSIVSSVARGKKKSGSVRLKVRNSEGEQLYVRYIRKSGTVIATASEQVTTIARASVVDLTIEQNAMRKALLSGSLVIPYYEFEPWWGNATECIRGSFGDSSYYYDVSTTNSNCDAFAPLHLPDGATITDLSCSVFDNTASTSISASIITRGPFPVSTGFATPGTTDSTSDQTISDTGTHVVDNGSRGYFIFMNSSSSNTVGNNIRINYCTVTYTDS